MFECKLCGDWDAVDWRYNARKKELTVIHENGERCVLQPCDEDGNRI